MTYTIGTLARVAGVHVETVRYYQRRGLLSTPPRPPGGTRRYGESDAARLRFIRHAQALGFSLAEIAELLRLDARRACAAAERLGRAQLAMVRERRKRLERIERVLEKLVRACRRRGGSRRCPLIEALAMAQDRVVPHV